MSDAVARWTAFLEKIETRHAELLAAAEASLPDLVPQSDFELLPFSNALTAVRVQCIELGQKIQRTWSDSAGAALEQAGTDTAQARQAGSRCAFRMQLALRRAEVAIAAAAADTVVERAFHILKADFKCKRCGAPLNPRRDFFRSHYVTCPYCQTVNTFEPGMVARQVEHFAVHALAERAALPAQLLFLEAEEHFRDRRSPQAPTRERLVELYGASVDAYLAERVRLLPDAARTLAEDRRAKMDSYIYSLA